MRGIFFVLSLFIVFFIVACGSVYENEPVGVGKDYSELKRSPCACLEIKKTPELPDWLT